FGATCASWSNHHSESWVSSLPLPGIGVGSTTSKTETLSDATRITSGPSAYTSRILPEWISSTVTPSPRQVRVHTAGEPYPPLGSRRRRLSLTRSTWYSTKNRATSRSSVSSGTSGGSSTRLARLPRRSYRSLIGPIVSTRLPSMP